MKELKPKRLGKQKKNIAKCIVGINNIPVVQENLRWAIPEAS